MKYTKKDTSGLNELPPPPPVSAPAAAGVAAVARPHAKSRVSDSDDESLDGERCKGGDLQTDELDFPRESAVSALAKSEAESAQGGDADEDDEEEDEDMACVIS